MEDILAIVFLFGGGTVVALAFSPFGKAVADRFRYGKESPPGLEHDPAVYEELEALRTDVMELQERLEFAERLLSKGSGETPPVSGGS